MKKIILPIITIILITLIIAFYYAKPVETTLKKASFSQLPGWDKADIKASFAAFQLSCHTFLRQDPNHAVGSQTIHLKAKDWQPICQAANAVKPVTDDKARQFFKTWFKPVEFFNNQRVNGLFTGYYMPSLNGSLVKTPEFNTPLYSLPDDLISVNLGDFDKQLRPRRLLGRLNDGRLVPYFTREAINKGALANHANVILWLKNPIDRLFLEIQGSGVVQLPDGKEIYIGYAGENGAPYTPVGRVLIDRGVMTKKNASMQKIKSYLESHPQEIDPVINQNQSFVFFRVLDQTAALGAQGVNLTPGYSLAVDRKWIPLGVPLWLDTTHPVSNQHNPQRFQRLMIAQDTGGAIRGMVRGDVYWGSGADATFIAGNMKNPGHYWLLLPRTRDHKLSVK